MPNLINAQGLETASQNELITFYTSQFQVIYGADITLTSDSPDGQMMNNFVQSILDNEDLITQVNAMFDPDQAIGVILDQRVAINGIQRQGGTFTTTNVTVVIAQPVNLYGLDQSAQPIYFVSDSAGNAWQLISSQIGVTPGTYVFAFQAAVPGAISSLPNTITILSTIVLGVTSVNNPTTYTSLGVDQESDAALRLRRQQSVSLQSQGYYAGLIAALENIPGVTSAFVHENNSGSTDATSTPGHTIWVIVAGTPTIEPEPAWSAVISYPYGAIVSSGGINYISWQNNNLNNAVTNPTFWGVYNPIAEAIYDYRNAGAGMRGSVMYTVVQVSSVPFVVSWDVVIAVPMFIKFTATSINGTNPPNIAAMRAGIPNTLVPALAQEININQVATAAQLADPNSLITFPSSSFGLGLAATGPFSNTLTPAALNDQFTIEAADIIILPMILTPPSISLVALATQTFTGLGGYGTYTYSISVNNSGGTINSGTGLYTAGSTTSVTDTILVTDSLGNTATASVTVT